MMSWLSSARFGFERKVRRVVIENLSAVWVWV